VDIYKQGIGQQAVQAQDAGLAGAIGLDTGCLILEGLSSKFKGPANER